MATYVRTQAIDHAIGERGSVALKVTSGDVRARAVAGGDAHLRATFEIKASSDAEADRIFEAIQLRVQRADGRLTVEELNGDASLGSVIGRIFGGIGHAGLTVEAEIPAAASLNLTGVSSDMEVSGFGGEQRYRTVSGDLLLSELSGSVQLETVSGDATIRADAPAPRPQSPAPASAGARESQLDVLRALERGEIDVDEATRRLEGGS